MKQKLFTFLLVLIASVGISSAQSGTCGDNLTWELNTETGNLTISGTGAMADYTYNTMPWYEYRSSIQSVIITDGVTSIGYETFSYCSSLTSVTIPNSVTSIGNRAFYNCSSLTSITIPNSVTSIGNEAFNGCSALTSPVYNAHCFAYMPPSYSGAYAIPEGIKQIAGSAFRDCSSLTSITIPNSVTSIVYRAFYNCTSLTSVTIPNSVTSIGEYAFYNVSNIVYHGTATGSPWGAKSVNGYVENNLVYADETKKILLACFTSAQGEIIIPNTVISIGNSAFDGCSSLTSVTIPNSVTSIGRSAFSYCSSLTSVTIGNSVTSIGYNAFLGCYSLTSVTIPNSVTSIGYAAFCGCSSLTSITIPNSVTSIENFAFDGCTSLTSITIPNSVKSIGDAAFSGCSSVTSVTIGNSVTSIGDQAFRGCSSLTSITIGNSVTSIGSSAFSYCSSLTSVTIPNSVTSIGESAFNGCSSLTSVTIGNSVTSIENFAFYGCTSLTSVTFEGSTPPSTDRDVFYNTNNCPIYVPCGTKDAYVTALNENNTIDESRVIEKLPYTYSVLTSDSTLGSVTITQEPTCTEPVIFRADAAEGYQFTQWSDGNTDNPRSLILTQDTTLKAEFDLAQCLIASGYCGADSTNLTWELSCDSVLTISGTGAMADYAYNTVPWYDYRSSILSVVISDSVTSIGDRAFTNCSSLSSVTIPNSVTSIGNYTFYGCSSLTSVTIGNSVTSIGNQAFYLCSSLTSITIPNSVTSIGNSAFFKCSSLTSVTIPNSVTSIGNSTFYDCSSLTSITIPNSVTSIGKQAFSRCSSLTSVTIPNSVTSIGNNAFDLCSSLTSVTIPNSVTSIGNTAFLRCSSLKSMIVESGNTVYDSRENCNAIIETATNTLIVGCQNTIIPNSVTSIGNSAFYGCSSLTSVTIPNSVTSIGNSVFRGCSSLTSITIPNSVTSIGSYTFYDCSSLTSVTIPNSVTSIGEFAFKDCSSLTSVTIPNSVTSIEGYAFYNCSSLTSVTFESITPPIIKKAFDNTNNCPIYVPCGTKDAYVAALNENNTIDESRVIEKLPYTYSVLTSDSTLGSVIITQEPTTCTAPLIFRADAAEGYQFAQWSDGNTDNPRSLILTQDTTLTALFEQIVIEQDTIIVADSTGISDIIPDGQDTIPYVEVQPDGEITIDITDVRIGVITIVTIGTESGQVHPGFGGNYNELENTRVVMEYVLNPFGQTASPDKWYAFAVPFEVDIENGITRKYGNKSHVPGKDFMILEYDSELRSKTGKGWVEKKSGSLTPGHIYMLGIEGNCNRWLFEKKRGAAIVGDKEKDLQHYAQGNSKNDGWQGLGNTTLEYVDMSFSIDDILYILVYDNQHSRYITYHIDELVLAVGQPFFVQTTQEGALVVFEHNNGKGKGNGKKNMPIYAPSYDVQPTLPRVRFTIENENINATPDRLYITLHDDNLSGSYIIGRDLMRMDGGSKQVPNFWCPMADGTQLSAHGVTMPTTYTTIPLGIFTPAKGEYTINAHMQDMNDYIVELYCQNVCLGILMQGVPFRLEMAAGTSYEYSIRISRRVSTDLNPAEDTQCDKDNKWYDVLGRPLPQDAHGIFIRKGEKIIK